VELSEEELDIVTERCSIEHMKKVNKFNYLLPLNTDKGLWDVKKDTILNSGTLVNKGEIGRGRLNIVFIFIAIFYQLLMYSYISSSLHQQAAQYSVRR
jgi:hypothetical protein